MNLLKVAFLMAATLTLCACNTVKGVGQDLQKAGAKIEDIAKK